MALMNLVSTQILMQFGGNFLVHVVERRKLKSESSLEYSYILWPVSRDIFRLFLLREYQTHEIYLLLGLRSDHRARTQAQVPRNILSTVSSKLKSE